MDRDQRPGSDHDDDSHGSFAAFLRAHEEKIISMFVERVRAFVPARHDSRSQIVNELPHFLEVTAATLERGAAPEPELLAHSRAGEDHGRQRLSLGYDLATVTREYGLLRDCVFAMLEQATHTPSLRELRVFTDCVSAASTDAVRAFVEGRQESLETERVQLLQLFQQAPGFVAYLAGPEHVFRLANAAYSQLVGHREVMGRAVREALPEVEGQGFFELLDRVRSTGDAFVGHAMPLVLQRTPGARPAEVFVDFIYQPIHGPDGQVAGIMVQGQEITAYRRAVRDREVVQARLSESEERYRTLFESVDEGYALLQLLFDGDDNAVDYRFLEANAAFERHTGLVDAVGRTARELVPNLDQSWFELYGKVALSGEPIRFENHAPAMDRWFEVYAARVGDGSKRQVALIFNDISDRKRADQARERTVALEAGARREAEEASRLKDEFLATVSHELRTPLHAILGWAHMLRSEQLGADRQARALETIERNARSQAQLIDDLLDISRITQGKLSVDAQPVNMVAVVEAALDTVRPAADAKQISLLPALSAGCHVLGDAQRLQQVAWNLLSNAIKFTPRGGSVHVTLECEGADVRLVVKDTGAGISAAFLPNVFERFRQAESSTTRGYGGLGLGLSIVRDLVRLHGGEVSAASGGTNQGATFTVVLPRDDAVRTLPDSASSDVLRRPVTLDGLKALVVGSLIEHVAQLAGHA